jgi:hypothetical protein
MKPQKRTINYFELVFDNYEGNAYSLAVKALDRIKDSLVAGEKPKLLQLTSRSDAYCVLHEITINGQYYDCKGKVVIGDAFPGVTDNTTMTETTLQEEKDTKKGLHYETHFIFSTNPHFPEVPTSLFAIESTSKGLTEKDIANYLRWQVADQIEDAVTCYMKPLFVLNLDTFPERINDVATLEMIAYRADLERLKVFDDNLWSLFKNAFDFAETEYVQLEFGIKFNVKKNRTNPGRLKSSVLKLVEKLQKFTFGENIKPLTHSGVSKMHVRAQDKYYGDNLRLFDILGMKVGSEVLADKRRERSQYFNSRELFVAMQIQLNRDFKGDIEK